jgi:hypothetical protein
MNIKNMRKFFNKWVKKTITDIPRNHRLPAEGDKTQNSVTVHDRQADNHMQKSVYVCE